MKVLKEWVFQAPWGKIAMISWGNPDGKRMLLVHGRQDSAATFIPLLELLPDTFHYVGFDMPGNGKSDPFPSGMITSILQGVVVVDFVVKHLEWKEFLYIGHSIGSVQGLFYNALYPNRIRKLTHLDANPALSLLLNYDFEFFYKIHYEDFYKNYDKYNANDRVYTKQQAVEIVMKNRNMTEAQAKLVMSRSLVQVGEDRYKLTWDRRAKVVVPPEYPIDVYYELFTKNIPPTFYVCAKLSEGASPESMEIIAKLISGIQTNNRNVEVVSVDGLHDVHFTNPERFSKELTAFLLRDFTLTSKL